MRQFFLFVFSIWLLVACNSSSTNKSAQDTQQEQVYEVKKISEQQFQDFVFNYNASPESRGYMGDKPCIVDCYASWCRPCKMIAPYFDSLAKLYGDKVNFYKIDVDEAKNLSEFFQIKSIPLVMFCDEEKIQFSSGAYPFYYYKNLIDSLLIQR